MSARKPTSLLSFIYNTTVDPPYRLEMHMDMEVAFTRFNIAARPRLPCYGVERAAYHLRASSDDVSAERVFDQAPHAAARAEMERATTELFAALADDLRYWVSAGAPPYGPSLAQAIDFRGSPERGAEAPWSAVVVDAAGQVTARPGYLLLDYLYFFVHFPETRRAISTLLRNPAQEAGVEIDADAIAALQELGGALNAPRGNVPIDPAIIRVLCDALQREYAQQSWLYCW